MGLHKVAEPSNARWDGSAAKSYSVVSSVGLRILGRSVSPSIEESPRGRSSSSLYWL